jgi:hypothetical protein
MLSSSFSLQRKLKMLTSSFDFRLLFQDKPETRGRVSKEYTKLYEEWGKGDIGVIVLGNSKLLLCSESFHDRLFAQHFSHFRVVPIDYEGLEARGNMIIDERSSYDPVENLKEPIRLAKAGGSLVIGQLTHGGRQTSVDVTGDAAPVSASDITCPAFGGMKFNQPRPLSVEEIKTLVQRWAYGAEVLHKAGADGMQLHGAHGYLLSQVSLRSSSGNFSFVVFRENQTDFFLIRSVPLRSNQQAN